MLVMGIIQGLADGEDRFHHLGQGEQLLGMAVRFQGLSGEVLHGDVAILIVQAGVVDRHDIGMVQATGGLGFDEKVHPFLVRGRPGDLDRHLAVDERVPSQVDHGRAPLAEFFRDLVPADLFKVF